MVKDLVLDYCIQILICTHTYTLQYLLIPVFRPSPPPCLSLVTQSIWHERGLREKRDPAAAGSDSRFEEGSETGSLLALRSYLWHSSRPFISLNFAPIFTEGGRGHRRMIFKKAEVINKLKGSLTRDFFHKSVSPAPLSIPLGPFQIFSKIRGDICEWMFISGVNDTSEKRNIFWNKFFFKYFVESLV
jgi:hypothetical protein